MKTDINRRLNKTCIDCGTPIVDSANRCHKCAAINRENNSTNRTFNTCKNCGNEFRVKPSMKECIKFCSKECKTNFYTISCSVCGKRFIPSHRNRNTIHTCSRKCRDIAHKNRISITCKQCGNQLEKPVSLVKNPDKSFCSKECAQEWWKGSNHTGYNSIECTCEMCGTIFTRTAYKVNHYGGKYCSRECSSASQVIPGTSDYRGPNWNEQKRKVRHRDNYTCRMCGIIETDYGIALDVHHIIPFRFYGAERYKEANKLSNLVSLCKHCHMKIEKGGEIFSFYETTSVSTENV